MKKEILERLKKNNTVRLKKWAKEEIEALQHLKNEGISIKTLLNDAEAMAELFPVRSIGAVRGMYDRL